MKRHARARPALPLTVESTYPHPPDKVWQALTSPRALSAWLLPTTDFRPEPGWRFTFRQPVGHGGRRTVHARVVQADAPCRLVFTWQPDGKEAALVTWTLTPVGEGTRVRVEHQRAALSALSLSFSPPWGRVLHCLLPRHLAEMPRRVPLRPRLLLVSRPRRRVFTQSKTRRLTR